MTVLFLFRSVILPPTLGFASGIGNLGDERTASRSFDPVLALRRKKCKHFSRRSLRAGALHLDATEPKDSVRPYACWHGGRWPTRRKRR